VLYGYAADGRRTRRLAVDLAAAGGGGASGCSPFSGRERASSACGRAPLARVAAAANVSSGGARRTRQKRCRFTSLSVRVWTAASAPAHRFAAGVARNIASGASRRHSHLSAPLHGALSRVACGMLPQSRLRGLLAS